MLRCRAVIPGDDAGGSGRAPSPAPAPASAPVPAPGPAPVSVPVSARFAGVPPPVPGTDTGRPTAARPDAGRPVVARRRNPLRSVALRLAWMVCALILAFGMAGIVGGMAHPTGTSAPSELTRSADQRSPPG